MLCSGKGHRFKKSGYKLSKPFIIHKKREIFHHSLNDLKNKDKDLIILFLKKDQKLFLEYKKKDYAYKKISTIFLGKILKGQAKSAYYSLNRNNLKNNAPVTILPCDMKFKINETRLIKKIKCFDLVVWTIRLKNYQKLNPNNYSFIQVNNEKVIKLSYKNKISNKPLNDFAVTGAFTFKNKLDAKFFFEQLFKSKVMHNNEFYIDSLVNLLNENNYKVSFIEIDKYQSFGVPEDIDV